MSALLLVQDDGGRTCSHAVTFCWEGACLPSHLVKKLEGSPGDFVPKNFKRHQFPTVVWDQPHIGKGADDKCKRMNWLFSAVRPWHLSS